MGPAQGSSAGMDLGRGCLITLRSNNLSLIIMVIKEFLELRMLEGLDQKMYRHRNVLYFQHLTRGNLPL